MGIFDVFKTKVNDAADKAGDVAEQAKDRVSDMVDKKKDGGADDPAAQGAAGSASGTVPGAEAATEDRASNMMYEGGPVATAGEAAPGMGEEGSVPQDTASPQDTSSQPSSGGGMTQSIRDNAAQGADMAGEKAKGATGNRYDEKIDSGVQQAKDKLG